MGQSKYKNLVLAGRAKGKNQVLPRTLVHTQSLHEFHETHHSVTFYFIEKDSKRCCDTTTPESIHTKDESKSGSVFAFIFGVN